MLRGEFLMELSEIGEGCGESVSGFDRIISAQKTDNVVNL